MKQRQIAWILPALLTGLFFISGCGSLRSDRVLAQPLTLATPDSAAANEVRSLALPQEIVVVIVTPTVAQDQGQPDQANQPGNQGGEGQAVAQAQSTPQSQEGGSAQGEATGGQQEPQEGGQGQVADQELIDRGEQVYLSNCARCHQPDGGGTRSYPALAGSPIVMDEDPAGVIDVVTHGRGQMPAFGESLPPEDIAAVISYVRNSWENGAGVVTVEQLSQPQGGEQAGGEQQAAPAEGEGQAQGEQAGGEAQATPSAEGGSAEQAAPAAEGEGQSQNQDQSQAAPIGEGAQISVTQEQNGNVITIQIEIVLSTPEASAAPAQPSGEAEPTPAQEQPAEGEEPTAAPEGESSGEAAPSGGEAAPSPEAEQPQATPAAEEAQPQATPAAEGGGAANETSGAQEGQGEASGEVSGEGSATQPESGTTTGEAGAAQDGDQELLSMGEYLYGTTCANCHQLSGEGNTAYPSLVNNEIVIAEDPTSALLTILQGRGHMPSFAGLLSDQEIAAILSHERNAWNNSASVVTPEQVAQVRALGVGLGGERVVEAPALESGATRLGASAQRDALSSDAEGATVTPGVQSALDFSRFLEIPGVAALISYIQAVWNNGAPLIANAQVQ
ncbi:MAG: c-type cytochrome [Caldilineaceae bacterium]|nr:c-type cytochrome [Caldilineaceae bacterium]